MAGSREGTGAAVSRRPSRRGVLRGVAGVGAGGIAGTAATDTVEAAGGDRRWSFDTGQTVNSPTVVDGTVYVGAHDDLYAVDAAAGTKEWRFTTTGITDPIRKQRHVTLTAASTVVDGRVFVTEDAARASTVTYAYALDAATGTERWRFQADGGFTPPTVASGTVFVGNSEFPDGGTVYALDAADGTERWRFRTDAEVVSTPVVADGTVYVGDLGGTVYALDPADGTERWTTAIPGDGSQRAAPTVADGAVYAVRSGTVSALDVDGGALRWSVEVGESVRSTPTVANGTLYVGTGTNDTGSEPADTSLYALDVTDGSERWSYATGGAVESSPTVAGDAVYVGSDDGTVYALDAADGTERWTYETGGGVSSSPLAIGGVVFVGSADGHLYALETTGVRTSDGSRSRLGPLGHHDGWQHAGGSVARLEPLPRARRQRTVGEYGFAALAVGCGIAVLLGLVTAFRSSDGTESDPSRTSGRESRVPTVGVPPIVIGAAMSTLLPLSLTPAGTYSLWRLELAPLLVQRLTAGFTEGFAFAFGVAAGWGLFVFGFYLDRHTLRRARRHYRLRSDAPRVQGVPSPWFTVAAASLPVGTAFGLPWAVVVPAPLCLAVGYFLHRTSVVSTGRGVRGWLGTGETAQSEQPSARRGFPDESARKPIGDVGDGSETDDTGDRSGGADGSAASDADASDDSGSKPDAEASDDSGSKPDADASEDGADDETNVYDSTGGDSATDAADETDSDTETRIFDVCSDCGADLSAHGHPDVCPECGTEQ